ncbi:MAG: cobalt ECF transporter T component CbiQ [Fusobacteriaceae bacterium]|jgi:cobalt/nickel transport system permease protein|nr:cobalt ECF transporter T component CbiQ [Fusobacteriaceae bacterium]
MANYIGKINEIYSLESLSRSRTKIHELHPMVKTLTTLVFIVTVVSFHRYTFGSMIPYIFYPFVIIPLSEIPYPMIFKRVLITLPFCLFAGISNIIFDRKIAITLAGIGISYGMISCLTIIYRTFLCVTAILIFVATTPISELTMQLRKMHIPSIFVTLLEMTYRYIGVLMEESYSMMIAYSLRNGRKKGIDIRHAGSFVGQLLLRSVDRAERVYAAMKCRGYGLYNIRLTSKKMKPWDIGYCIFVCGFCVLFRFYDINKFIFRLMGGH